MSEPPAECVCRRGRLSDRHWSRRIVRRSRPELPGEAARIVGISSPRCCQVAPGLIESVQKLTRFA